MALTVSGLRGTVVDNVDLEVRRGEVVGIAGLTGSGREEILPLIFGAVARGGQVLLDGRPVPPIPAAPCVPGWRWSPRTAAREGAVLGSSAAREPHASPTWDGSPRGSAG